MKKCKYCGIEFEPKKKSQIYCCVEHQKLYYKKIKYHSIASKNHYEQNKELYKQKHKEYYNLHKKETIERGRINRAKRSKDSDYILKHRLRSQIRDHLKRNSLKKSFYTFETLGYTVEDLKEHISKLFEINSKQNKPKMSWYNMGTVWHIDHIRPCASFKFANEDGSINISEIKECWSLSNLQPLYSEDNIHKSSNYNGNHYEKGMPKN